jgi:hypothetical protein
MPDDIVILDLLDSGTVVPRTVEQDDLPGRGQVRNVTLEIPLPPLALGGDIEGDYPRCPGIQMRHEALDSTALTSSVPALEDNDKAAPRILHPILQLEQLDLKQPFLVIVLLTAQPFSLGIIFPPGVYHASVRVAKHRVILV